MSSCGIRTRGGETRERLGAWGAMGWCIGWSIGDFDFEMRGRAVS